ncbi:uncharacterized protein LOC129248396 isoform X2 [Anastrepha obliqua]|uniref:uncharacterized protein LOC129248396 isoform X2 n=1 Tax=Anastrepha obliqua TaxID=95512 RepID=UPI00240A44BE|nr:uncharacterized protein LOC129248396 isoform X2 [Anastrepha obliqua]
MELQKKLYIIVLQTKRITMKSLLELNDDCLIEIFQYLSLVETFNVIDVHNNRLTDIARQRIATFKELNIQIREFPNFTSKQLQIIGASLRSLIMSAGYSIPTQTVLNIIKPLCEGAATTNQLREFTLNYVYFNKEICHYIGNVATKLQKLNLSYCQLTDELLTELLKKCTNLKELHVLGNYTLNGYFLQNLCIPTLRLLKLEQHAEWNFSLEAYKIKNPNIQLITI